MNFVNHMCKCKQCNLPFEKDDLDKDGFCYNCAEKIHMEIEEELAQQEWERHKREEAEYYESYRFYGEQQRHPLDSDWEPEQNIYYGENEDFEDLYMYDDLDIMGEW